jgi:hypothetical protein
MGFLKRKKKDVPTPALQAEARSAPVARPPPFNHAPSQSPQDAAPGNPSSPITQGSPSTELPTEAEHPDQLSATEDWLDPNLIGRTIKLVRADGWEEDIIPTAAKETHILYENQRG